MKIKIESHRLEFIKPAKTSRGQYTEKIAHILVLDNSDLDKTVSSDNDHADNANITDDVSNFKSSSIILGEVSPLPDLSIDGKADFNSIVLETVGPFEDQQLNLNDLIDLREEWSQYPALRFGLDSILQELKSPPFSTPFTRKEKGIPINGLVWMNDIESMEEEALHKIESGFKIIKFKVGALDFDAECRLLERIRKKYSAFKLEIRLDANGAFSRDTALEQLRELSRFEIHSLEQPIKAGQRDDLTKICSTSPIDIALDEELIGYSHNNGDALRTDVRKLLTEVSPKYIILKPTFIGGFDRCDIWVEEAWKKDIGWWSTSALEGNIGLFSIAKWASKYMEHPRFMVQGLGTGSLFVKNFPANSQVKNGHLYAL